MREETVRAVNLSERGMYFETALPLEEGAALELSLEMPEEITGVPTAEWRCLGVVVRTDHAGAPAGKIGVAVRFEACEVVRGAQFKIAQEAPRERAPRASRG